MAQSTHQHALVGLARGRFGDVASGQVENKQRPSARILVIDDEPWIGQLVKNALDGDQVEVFQSPRAALARAREVAFDAVVCDFNMPELTGLELHAELARTAPSLARHFVLMTGSSGHPAVEQFLGRTELPLLAKPFGVADVVRQVWAILERP